MDIVSVVVAVCQRLDIGLCDSWLFGELVLQHMHRFIQRTFEQPTNQPQCEHILTTERRLVIQAEFSQAVFHHCRDRSRHDLHSAKPEFPERIVCRELRLVQVTLLERIRIDQNDRIRFQVFHIHFQRSGIHCDQHVRLIARSKNFTGSQMNLET